MKHSLYWFGEEEHYVRVRVTMKGHYIWQTVNGRRIYLDDQTFGIPGSEDTLLRERRRVLSAVSATSEI